MNINNMIQSFSQSSTKAPISLSTFSSTSAQAQAPTPLADTTEDNISQTLHHLSDKFINTLQQYNEIYHKYILIIKKHINNPVDLSFNRSLSDISSNHQSITDYEVIPHSIYGGYGGVTNFTDETPANSESDCIINCYNKNNCFGATYDSSLNTCNIQTAPGQLSLGTKTQSAIVKKRFYYKNQLDKLNDRLSNIIAQIATLIRNNRQFFDKNNRLNNQLKEIYAKHKLYYNHYSQIFPAAALIHKGATDGLDVNTEDYTNKSNNYINSLNAIIAPNEPQPFGGSGGNYDDETTLTQANQNSSLIVNERWYKYIFYFFIAIVLGILFVKIVLFSSPSESQAMPAQNFIGGKRLYKFFR